MEKVELYITNELNRRGYKPEGKLLQFYYKDCHYSILILCYSYQAPRFDLCIIKKDAYYASHKTKMGIPFDNFKEDVDSQLVQFKKPPSWSLVKCTVRLLSLHSRAVVTANHPLRKLERGEFKDEEE